MNIELEHSVAKLRKENETLKKHYKDLYDSIKITISKTIEQTTSLLANNADLKAQIQEKRRESAFSKHDHMIASSESRNSSKNMPRFSSNDMVHNHYLDEARKTIQERDRNSKLVSLHDIGKLFDSCTGKVDCEPTHCSNVDIPNIHECKQTLDLSAGSSLTGQQKQIIDFSAGASFNVKQENLRPRSSMSTEVPTADMIFMTSMMELESLFGPLFDKYFNGENQVVLKPSIVTTTEASDKR
ncbi:hypothetical protein Tco_1099387 [Tanacetum coccineum]